MTEDKEPRVLIKDVAISDIKPEYTLLSVKIAVHNPLPLDAKIKRLVFMLYRLTEDLIEEYMGEGEEKDISVKGARDNIIEIPVYIKNRSIVSAAANFLTGDLTVIIRGSIFFDLKLFAPEIKFEENKVVKGLQKMLFEE